VEYRQLGRNDLRVSVLALGTEIIQGRRDDVLLATKARFTMGAGLSPGNLTPLGGRRP